MRLRACLFASAIFILLINAAPSPAATAAPVDTCSLLSQAEMSAAIGTPMHPGEHDVMGNMRSCTWRSPQVFPRSGPRPPLVVLQLWVMPFDKRIFDAEGQRTGKENVISVSDLGDTAYFATYGGAMTVLNVKKGDIHVQLTWIGTVDQQSVLDGEKTIAAQVLSEL
jgi:hypothetical protein